MSPTARFDVELQHGSLEWVVLDRPMPHSASFEERNRLAIRLVVSPKMAPTSTVEGTLYLGDFVRFSRDLEICAHGRWYPSDTRTEGDPLWKRDELHLPLSCGLLAIAFKMREGSLPYYELSYRPGDRPAPEWLLALELTDLNRLREGFDAVYNPFDVHAIPEVTEETSETTCQWLEQFKDELVDNWYFLRLEALRARGWGAVLCLKYWLTEDVNRTQQLVEAIGRLTPGEMLAYAFITMGEVPQVARIPASLDGLVGYLSYRPIDNVLFTSPDGSFAMLVTHEDHMILAGPSSFIYDAFQGFLFELRLDFRHLFFEEGPAHPHSSNLAVIMNQDRWLGWDLQYATLLREA